MVNAIATTTRAMRGSFNDGPQVTYIYQREGEPSIPPPRKNAAELFRINHRAAHSGRDKRRHRPSARELLVKCPQLETLKKRRAVAETRVTSMGRPYVFRKMSDSSLCPDCVQSLIAMRRKRRRQSRTRRLQLTLNDLNDLNEESNSNASEFRWSEDDRYEPSVDSYRSVPSVKGDALLMMRSGSGGKRLLSLKASQFLCPRCIRSLNNLNAVLKRRHQEKVPSTKHGPRYKRGSGIRRRAKNAVLNMDSPSKCVFLENVDDHVMRQPIENVTKMATLFVNKMMLPPRGKERNAQASKGKLDDSNAKLADRNKDLADNNENLDDSNPNLDDWNRSDDSQEPSLSTHRSFPSLSDEPMVREVPIKNNNSKDRSRKRLCEPSGAGAGSAQDGGGCKRCRRASLKKEETNEQNQN